MDLNTLNREQREAVERIRGPLMILAGAGTGKTRVMTFRIAYMIQRAIHPQSIVALSFTNKAAKEMGTRVKELLGKKADKVWLGTFHRFCLDILRKHGSHLGLHPQFSLADTSDQIELVRKALEEKNWTSLYKADDVHSVISRCKNDLIGPKDLLKSHTVNLGALNPEVLFHAFELYERQLSLHRVIDFDDCIYKCVRLLTEHPHVRSAVREKYQHLMVDEYQDTNLAQLKVLELLASESHDCCVVGDDDQSIYSWRGAAYEVIDRFSELFPSTHIIKLEQNYRCTNRILNAANTVIKHNTTRREKTLWSSSSDDIPIEVRSLENDEEETEFVLEKVLALLGQGLQPKDIAVLYRANNQSKSIELKLREARITTKTYGGQSFFERKEVKDFFCYIRLILNPKDRLALWRIINTPSRGIGLKTLELIEKISLEDKKDPYDAMVDINHEALQSFHHMLEDLRKIPLKESEDLKTLGLEVIKRVGLVEDIRNKVDNAPLRERKITNLRALPQWLFNLGDKVFGKDRPFSKQDLLDILTLDRDFDKEDAEGQNHVSLMSIHAAKGLEFPCVFLIGVEEELLPHKNSMLDGALVAEERRLFYVALTRAKKWLFISHCRTRKTGFEGARSRVESRFLKELPEGISRTTAPQMSHEDRTKARKTQTLSKISALRQALKDSQNTH